MQYVVLLMIIYGGCNTYDIAYRGLLIMLKILPIMLAALVKNFAYYAQIMLTEIEQFPDIYSMHCLQICTCIGE